MHFVTGYFSVNVVFCVDSKKKFYKKFYKTAPTSKSSTTKLVVAVELFFLFVGVLVLTMNPEKNSTNQNHTKVLQKSSTILTAPNDSYMRYLLE